MELTRRDAIAVLAATGVAGGGAVLVASDRGRGPESDDGDESSGTSDAITETATALTPVLYPDEVTDAGEFVRTYVEGRTENDADHRSGMVDAVAALDDYANEEHGETVPELSVEQRNQLLVDLGLDRVQPDPDGSDLERIRFYLVNDLLYALFSSPTGGELVGAENPPGHPGGLDSYTGATQG